MSKLKLAIICGAVVTLFGAGAIAYAANNGFDNSPGSKSQIFEGAAEKGIISQEQVDNLKNYTQEQRKVKQEERMNSRIDKGIENGNINEDEANQIREWIKNKPEAMDKLGGMKYRRGNMENMQENN